MASPARLKNWLPDGLAIFPGKKNVENWRTDSLTDQGKYKNLMLRQFGRFEKFKQIKDRIAWLALIFLNIEGLRFWSVLLQNDLFIENNPFLKSHDKDKIPALSNKMSNRQIN